MESWNIIHIATGESFDEEFNDENSAYEWLKAMISKIDGQIDDYAVEKQENCSWQENADTL